ncbi:MAG: hypothetical protein MUQ32_08410, partial [Chloroflexi bacterium]|nr:hypothetical protein [Chloroflexota bacterium]
AAWALEQGRGLHIVPGRLDDPAVAGCLAFLREAGPEARIVAGVPELLEDLGLLDPAPARAGSRDPLMADLTTVERDLVGHILAGRGTVDELVSATGAGGATVLGALTSLEVRGMVLEAYGRYRPAGALAARSSRPRIASPGIRGPGGRRAA